MSQPDLNPYVAPAEDVQKTARYKSTLERRLADACFAFALGAPLIAVFCATVGINLGLWDMIGRVVPMPFSLLLYLAISWTGVLLSYVGYALAVVCVFTGRWWQRIVIVAAAILYIAWLRGYATLFLMRG